MPDERALVIGRFLDAAGWGSAARTLLAGDASARRYERLAMAGARAILMDTGAQSPTPFLRVARELTARGLSAPGVLAADEHAGLVLLEDLGDALFSAVLAAEPAREAELYLAATEALLAVQSRPAPDLPDYGTAAMVEAIGIAHDWYAPEDAGPHPRGQGAAAAALSRALEALPPWRETMVLRDFHAENLFWLPDRAGVARVGLIDFQDSVRGHPIYDLVSLSRDVRRQVAPSTAAVMLDRFSDATGQDRGLVAQAAAVIAAQRNLRILGVFARLARRDGKTGYLRLLPATWSRLMEDLAHLALAELAEAVISSLPEPSPSTLARLRQQCTPRMP